MTGVVVLVPCIDDRASRAGPSTGLPRAELSWSSALEGLRFATAESVGGPLRRTNAFPYAFDQRVTVRPHFVGEDDDG